MVDTALPAGAADEAVGRTWSAARAPGRPGWPLDVRSRPGASTPTTVMDSMPLIVTVVADRVGGPNSSVAVSRPEHGHRRRRRRSSVVGEEAALGQRPGPHRQPVGRRADDRRRPVGACRRSATASWLDRRDRRDVRRGDRRGERARRRLIVSVEAEPKPPRTPVVLVVLPGETISRLLPSDRDLGAHLPAGALSPRPTVRITAAIPIRMPSMVSPERSRWLRMASQPVRSVSQPVHRRADTGPIGLDPAPSRTRTIAPRPARRLGLVGDQHDRAALRVQLVEQRQRVLGGDRVEVAGRLVGQDQRRVGDQRPGDRDPLLLTAGQLTGPVLDPVGQPDPVEGLDAPAACARPRSTPA